MGLLCVIISSTDKNCEDALVSDEKSMLSFAQNILACSEYFPQKNCCELYVFSAIKRFQTYGDSPKYPIVSLAQVWQIEGCGFLYGGNLSHAGSPLFLLPSSFHSFIVFPGDILFLPILAYVLSM